jgi:uncharacterized protein (DUF1800 family)
MMHILASRTATVALMVLVVGCTTTASTRPAGAPQAPTVNDAAWLDRVTFGANAHDFAALQRVGRNGYLGQQLSAGSEVLPDPVTRQLEALEVSHLDPVKILHDLNAENQRINALPEGPEREQARRTLNDHGNLLAYDAQRRELLRAIYSGAQLREQLVAFWLNHFSVFQYKGNVRWLVGDYAEHAIRPHVLGHFRDLVLATLQHPAMLQYLDNAQNAVGHLNENYARELMELHTLGVDGGYTQADVQALARILTGVGINAGADPPRLKKEWQPLYLRAGAFEFSPARHDFGDKQFLGATIHGSGFHEVQQAVDSLVRSPACARFIAHKLAVEFVADEPPAVLVARLAEVFQRSDGDIALVMRALIESHEFQASLGGKFKDPLHYVVSSVRLAYDTRAIANAHPLLNWLNSLGEAPFNRQTPDGYPQVQSAWASSGQMSRRFEIARAIGSGSAGLFEAEDGTAAAVPGFPRLASALYFNQIEPALSPGTRAVLDSANSQQEWNLFLLASPERNTR